MKDGKLIYSLHIHGDFSVSSHQTVLQRSVIFILFYLPPPPPPPSVLEHIKETSLDRFGEKNINDFFSSFGMNSCNKILVMSCLLHYFHFVPLLSNVIPKINNNYEL